MKLVDWYDIIIAVLLLSHFIMWLEYRKFSQAGIRVVAAMDEALQGLERAVSRKAQEHDASRPTN